ncbi:unnamed protein product [Cylicocyclus nassatus]|uniref:Uncharacterized protein n=1 Tax=Cylicocyclus nassatus TaxID=53992 RepID=A0AA36GHG9_CYLNA|nr:unnamed protein product [Cylicocyclus nassatus]
MTELVEEGVNKDGISLSFIVYLYAHYVHINRQKPNVDKRFTQILLQEQYFKRFVSNLGVKAVKYKQQGRQNAGNAIYHCGDGDQIVELDCGSHVETKLLWEACVGFLREVTWFGLLAMRVDAA